ncbi:MAG: CHASE domain-containing protein [Methyloprofundus sp.]|nr:CHASE domain-containing protein [Methyloprofundus sp.]
MAEVNAYYQQVNTNAQINESILEGFSAMISTTQDLDRARIRNYAQKILKQYPHIFMFEIAEKVPKAQLQRFSDYYRKNIFPEFKVKAFSFETDRQWHPVTKAKHHIPIIFIEPFISESEQILGLDINSNEFFKRALQKSEKLNRSIASEPFKLIEGDLAYLIHKPISAAEQNNQSYINKSGAQGGFALLVIRADTLLETKDHAFPNISKLLYNRNRQLNHTFSTA